MAASSSSFVSKVICVGVEKRGLYPNKQHYYALVVVWSDGSKHPAYRKYSSFFDFLKLLRHQVPAETALPELPPLSTFKKVFNQNQGLCQEIEDVCMEIVRLPEEILRTHVVKCFFEPWQTDVNVVNNVPPTPVIAASIVVEKAKKEKKVPSAAVPSAAVPSAAVPSAPPVPSAQVPSAPLQSPFGAAEHHPTSSSSAAGGHMVHVSYGGGDGGHFDRDSGHVDSEDEEEAVEPYLRSGPVESPISFGGTSDKDMAGANPLGQMVKVNYKAVGYSQTEAVCYSQTEAVCYSQTDEESPYSVIHESEIQRDGMGDTRGHKSKLCQRSSVGHDEEEEDDFQFRLIEDYHSEDDNHVSAKAGDIVNVLEQNSDGWWFVSLSNNPQVQGYVPGSYLEPTNPHAADTHCETVTEWENPLYSPTTFMKGRRVSITVTASYTAADEEEISLEVGDELEVVEVGLHGWWTVRSKTRGCVGLVPLPAIALQFEGNKEKGAVQSVSSDCDSFQRRARKMSRRDKPPPKPKRSTTKAPEYSMLSHSVLDLEEEEEGVLVSTSSTHQGNTGTSSSDMKDRHSLNYVEVVTSDTRKGRYDQMMRKFAKAREAGEDSNVVYTQIYPRGKPTEDPHRPTEDPHRPAEDQDLYTQIIPKALRNNNVCNKDVVSRLPSSGPVEEKSRTAAQLPASNTTRVESKAEEPGYENIRRTSPTLPTRSPPSLPTPRQAAKAVPSRAPAKKGGPARIGAEERRRVGMVKSSSAEEPAMTAPTCDSTDGPFLSVPEVAIRRAKSRESVVFGSRGGASQPTRRGSDTSDNESAISVQSFAPLTAENGQSYINYGVDNKVVTGSSDKATVVPRKHDRTSEDRLTERISANLEVDSPLDSSLTPNTRAEKSYIVAVKSYDSTDPNILGFRKGDLGVLVKKSSQGWWYINYLGVEGYVPGLFWEPLFEEKKEPNRRPVPTPTPRPRSPPSSITNAPRPAPAQRATASPPTVIERVIPAARTAPGNPASRQTSSGSTGSASSSLLSQSPSSSPSSQQQQGDGLSDQPWYHQGITRHVAEDRLIAEGVDGTFLIRDSTNRAGDLSLSIKFDRKIRHFPIVRKSAGCYYFGKHDFKDLSQVIAHYSSNPLFFEHRKPVSLCQPLHR